MIQFKFTIRNKGAIITVFEVGTSLTEAFEAILRRYPEAAYVSHYEK